MAADLAAEAAIERERAAWQRKLERGRARFRQMIGAVTSQGRPSRNLGLMKPRTSGRTHLWRLRRRTFRLSIGPIVLLNQQTIALPRPKL
jgi:hypothetical protein